MAEEETLYWGMHFCNPRMFKTVAKVEMYIREQKRRELLSRYIQKNIQSTI